LGEIGDEECKFTVHQPPVHRVARGTAGEIMDGPFADDGTNKFHQPLAHHHGIQQTGQLLDGVKKVPTERCLIAQVGQPLVQTFFFFLQGKQRRLPLLDRVVQRLLIFGLARG